MNNHNQDLRVSARSYRLTAAADGDEDGPPWRFGGIAVAAGDILHTRDGQRVLFTDEELQAAAESQAGEPLTKDHPEDDQGRPKYPPDVDETFGKVDKAGWVDDHEGVGYEAVTHDETIASGVQGGSYEVSVHPFFDTESYDGAEADLKAVNITFGDLSVVSKGDSPSNTATWGPNQALASWTETADIGSELTAADVEEDEDTRGLIKRLAEHFGIIDSRDRRGGVFFADQTTDGESVDVEDASFDDAPWMISIHPPGEEYPDVGDGLGPEIGMSEPYEPGEYPTGSRISLDESIEEDQTLFALLRYHADGDVSEPIPRSDGGYYLDSAFVAVAPDGVIDETSEVTAGEADDDEPAESGDGADTTSDMGDTNGGTNDGSDGPDGDAGGDGQTLGDMTVDELGDALREQGFVTEDDADELVDQATAKNEKAEKVDEIVAKSDDYEEEDREDLMASADTLVEKEFKRVRGEAAANLPGNTGAAASLTAGSDSAVDEYGTGVKEDN
ncbi:hypothetical protein C464_06245 [Halorubrum coriense DSM 10284]|uniref:DUF7282 domain-containing protein n=1 Tax=Halorubrum coriense DSM 10284 TaxID=1227466 RepID=M0ERF7_9EURY|nr:hypothetical protein [Halorubrum coriense]ELZ48989.1 hypothetical protein C464_06245 [Halorubrum coriense DSM 10284]QRG24116.1 prohead protease [Halorubrum virus Humcor1]